MLDRWFAKAISAFVVSVSFFLSSNKRMDILSLAINFNTDSDGWIMEHISGLGYLALAQNC